MSWTRTGEENWLYILKARWDESGPSARNPALRDEVLDLSTGRADHKTWPIFNMKWFYDVKSKPMSKNLDFSLYTYAAITGLPDIDSNGFLCTTHDGTSTGLFRMSWVQNMYKKAAGCPPCIPVIASNSYSNSANGSWDEFANFWLIDYPSTSFFSIVAHATNSARTNASTGGEIIEVLKSKSLRPLAIEGEGAFIPGPGTISPYYGAFPLGTYVSSVADKMDWPWLALTGVSTTKDVADRDFRYEHLSINSAIEGFPQVLEDLTNRYKTSTLVDAQAEEYVNKKYEFFEQLLNATIEVPKEFRVRSQASPTFDMFKLSSMAMPSGTDTTTTPGSLGTTGGSSY